MTTPGRASQIDVDMVRDALAQLGVGGGGGGPDLSAEVAQLQADVAALQATDADTEARLVAVEDVVGNLDPVTQLTAWVTFDGTTDPPTLLNGYQVADVTKNAPGAFTVSLGINMGSGGYGALFGSTTPIVETGRTSNSIDIDCDGVDPSVATVAILGVPVEPA